MRQMKKILGLLIGFWASVGFAQNSLLFEIKSPESNHSSYLFGTLHMADNEAFQWNDSVLWAIDQTNKALFELDLDTKKLGRQTDDIKGMMTEWEAYFKNEIAPEVEPLIDADTLAVRVMSIYGQVMDLAKTMRDADRADFVDQFIQDYARKQGKEIIGIETAMEQLVALTSVDKAQLKKALIKFIKKDDWDIDLNTALGDQSMLIDAYSKLDLDAVCDMMEGVVNGSSNAMINAMYERLLITRNEIMYNRVKDIVAQEPVFIGVGAGHLCGKTGLVQRFEKAGYVVRPVDISTKIAPLEEWATFSNELFSVDVPQSVSNFYETGELSPRFGALYMSGSSKEATWYTHKGKVKFLVEQINTAEEEPVSEDDYFDMFRDTEPLDNYGFERIEMEDTDERSIEELQMELEPVEVPQTYDVVEADEEIIEPVPMVEDDMDDIEAAEKALEEAVAEVEAAIEEEMKIVEGDMEDAPPATEYRGENNSGVTTKEDEDLLYNKVYWDRFNKRMKSEMMSVMFSGFGGFGAQEEDESEERTPVFVEVMDEEYELIVNQISSHTISYRLKFEHEGQRFELQLTGDSTAFEDGEVLRFFNSFEVH